MNYTKKQSILNLVAVVLIILLSLLTYLVDSEIAVSVTIFISSVAALAVFLQMRKSKELATGEFILALQQEFTQNNGCSEFFSKCWTKIENNELMEYETHYIYEEVLNYMTFFESIYLMVERDVLDVKLLDDLFGRRFFAVVNNIAVQENDLVRNHNYYINVYKLHSIWKKFRQKEKSELYEEDFKLKNCKIQTQKDLGLSLKEVDEELYLKLYI